MKRFPCFPFHNNPNCAPSAKSRGILHPEFVLSAYLIGALVIGLVACSKGKEKPVATTSAIAPAAAPIPAASAPAVTATAPPALPVARKKVVRRRPTRVTYKNDVYGFEFQYPRRYALKTGDEAIIDWFGSQPVGMNFIQPGGVSVAAVELPRGSFPGTDYHDAFFTVNVNRQISEDQCSQFSVLEEQQADEESVAPQTVNIAGQSFVETTTFNGESTEQAYARYYHKYENGVCYEVALGVKTAGYGVIDGITAVDRDDVFAKLEPMLASMRIEPAPKIRPETSVATAASPSQAAAQTSIH